MATRKTVKAPAAAAPAPAPAVGVTAAKPVKPRLFQEDVPSMSIDAALRVARAIGDEYAFRPTKPVNVAGAMGMTHTSGPFRAISGASAAYGITTGAAQGAEIGITPLGMRILQPTVDGDDIAAKREALLRPKIVGDFLRTYDGATLPSEAVAKNVLAQKGVPLDRTASVLSLIIEGGTAVGFIRDFGNGKLSVDLAGPIPAGGIATPAVVEAAAATPTAMAGRRAVPAAAATPVSVAVGPGIHINIEIHIAADATSETVEEIFKNMRRYVLNDGKAEDGQTDAE
jgi:hypothetical protein